MLGNLLLISIANDILYGYVGVDRHKISPPLVGNTC